MADAPTWLLALGAVLGVSLVSLVGALAFVARGERVRHVLPYLVSLAAGAMLGSAFLHLVPEIVDAGWSRISGLLVLAGLVGFFLFERTLHFHHHGHAEDHAVVAPYAWLVLAGDGLHNFADGLIIASAFQHDVALGWTTTIAVALHEIPQEIGDVGILLQGRMRAGRVFALNVATGLVALLGAAVALVLGGRVEGFHAGVLAVTAGGFVYVAAADLMPELHRERRPAAATLQVGCLVAGVLLMLALD